MGNTSKNYKKKSLAKKLLRKKGWARRQKQKELKNTQIDHDTENVSTDPPSSVELLSDVTNSEISVEKINILHQNKKKQMDNKVKTEAYDKEGVFNGNIKYCEGIKDFISVNINNNVEETERHMEECACKEIIEHCKNDEDLISTKTNVKELEDCNGEGTHNQSVEYFKIKKDIDNNNSANASSTQEDIDISCIIVNFSYFWHELRRVFIDHARENNCQFEYWKLVDYRRYGLLTQIFFECEICHYKANIWSEPLWKKPDINAAVVAGSIAAGMSFSELRKLLASMDIVCMSYSTYLKYWRNLVSTQKKNKTKNTKQNCLK